MPKSQKQLIVDCINNGVTDVKEIQSITGVSHMTVYRWFAKFRVAIDIANGDNTIINEAVLIWDYLQGASIDTIAQVHNVTVFTLYKIVNGHGVPPSGHLTEAYKTHIESEAYALYNTGMYTQKEIAKMFGISTTRLYKAFRRADRKWGKTLRQAQLNTG